MATLTATEFARIRDMIGDSKHDTRHSGFDLTEPEIQAEWDRANGHSSEQAEYKAYYYMLQRRRGIWLNEVDTQSETGSTLQNQKLRNIERLLKEYKELAGVGTFTMSVTQGSMDFGLDQDDPVTGANLED